MWALMNRDVMTLMWCHRNVNLQHRHSSGFCCSIFQTVVICHIVVLSAIFFPVAHYFYTWMANELSSGEIREMIYIWSTHVPLGKLRLSVSDVTNLWESVWLTCSRLLKDLYFNTLEFEQSGRSFIDIFLWDFFNDWLWILIQIGIQNRHYWYQLYRNYHKYR